MAVAKATVKRRRGLKRDEVEGILFASPWIVGFLLFTLGPMVMSLLMSFTTWDGIRPISDIEWVGLANYTQMVGEDELFRKALFNTFYYAMCSVPLGTVVALALAVLLNQPVKGIAIFRSIFYLPSIVSGVATAMLWLWLFNPSFGLVNYVLGWFGIEGPGWLTEERWTIPTFILMSVWGVGNGMMIYLAGLQNAPEQLYEAADLDGASPWAKFRNVTLPILTPTILFNLVMAIIGQFQIFTSSYIMTNGGPNNASLFYVLYLYRKAFEHYQMGYASAMAWIFFLIILAITALVFRSSAMWVYYEGERG